MKQSYKSGVPSDMTIGVVGLGSVGTAVKHALSFYYPTCVGYDIDGRGSFTDILQTDIAFVCVPTPGTDDGHLDCSAVLHVLRDLSIASYSGICVVKSTVNVGFMDMAQKMYPNLKLVYNPEFLREKSNFTWTVNPDRLVLSGNDNLIEQVLSVYTWIDGIGTDVPVLRMRHVDAETAKLAHNAFIAGKVTFTNEIEHICCDIGADPDTVMGVIHADRRVKSKEHLMPGLGPYGGKCVPKDTCALIAASKSAELLRKIEELNRIWSGEY